MRHTDRKISRLADELGVTPQACGRYVRGERIPEPEVMRKLHELSGGRVRADHFYGIGAPVAQDEATRLAEVTAANDLQGTAA